MKTIHLGIPPFVYKPREEARAAIIDKINPVVSITEDTWIGIIAELHPVKGLLYAIDAVALLQDEYPSLRIILIGEGDQRTAIEKQIAKRRLQEKVFLTGFIDDAKTLVKAFDLFMLPSLSEAFGYTIVEAGLAEVPVIATSVGGIPEVIDDAGIIVPPKNSRKLADAVDSLLSSKQKRMRLAEVLHERAQKEFSVERMVSQTLDIYSNKA